MDLYKVLAMILSCCLGVVTFIIVFNILGLITIPLVNWLKKLGGQL